MTIEEMIAFYKERLVNYRNLDATRAHILADSVLIELLKALGFGEVTEEYDRLCDLKADGWYQ